MRKFNEITRYECNSCKEIHDELIDAQECCEPCEINVFICSICDEEFIDLPPDNHKCPDGAIFRFNQRELEKNGQTRFI